MSRYIAIGVMTIGILCALVGFIVSLSFFDSNLYITYPAAPYIFSFSLMVGIFPTVFLIMDFLDLLNYSNSIDYRMFIWLMGSVHLSGYIIAILAILFEHGMFPLQYLTLFAFFFGPPSFGVILYFLARPILAKHVESIIYRRRRGKRSSIKKGDIRKLAEDGEIEKLCQVLVDDINFRNRELAAELLGGMSDVHVEDTLIRGLSDDETVVQLACAISLLSFKNYEGQKILEATFTSGHREDRVKVMEALKNVDADWAVSILRLAEVDDDDQIRKATTL